MSDSSGFIDWIRNNTPMFIGIIAAVILVIIVIVALAVMLHSRKKNARLSDNGNDSGETAADYDASEEETIGEQPSSAPAVSPESAEAESAEETTAPVENPAQAENPGIAEETSEPFADAPAEKPHAADKESAKQRKPAGRWTIEMKGEGEYMSKLSASNGEVMLSSEIYASEEGARAGIATIIKGVENGHFVTYRDKSGNYYYKLKTANNRLLCVGEIYRAKDQCARAIETVKRIAATAVISDELAEGEKYIRYVPVRTDDGVRTARGKWRVEKTEDGKYCAKLFASNGQLMLATEEVATRKGAENAIVSVKRNAAEGNFIIDRDKFGRYYYKLRNSAKSVICIGEVYESLDSCMRAIESVRRFAATAVTGAAE